MKRHRFFGALLGLAVVVAGGCGGGDTQNPSGGGAGGSGGSSSATAGSGPGGGSATGGGGAGPLEACGEPVTQDTDVMQVLPTLLDTTFTPPTGKTIAVAAGGDLQAAIDKANLGDEITVEAGASFTGPFTLPAKSGKGTLVIRSSAPDAKLPAPGARVDPSFASAMPKILAPDMLPAFQTAAGAHDIRLVGLEITPVDAAAQIYVLVQLGDGTSSSMADVPHDLVLDRVYVHGTTDGYVKRGVGVDCARCAVIDSYVSDCHAVGQDAQAIAGFNGPGPIKIVGNYLEGSGENVLFGGADPQIPNLVPSDIEIRRNHFYKPLTWKADDPSYAGNAWSVKNLLELKNAQRVLVDCNVFENIWADAQVGFAILLTPRNQDGTAPWCAVGDVTIERNVIRHAASGIDIAGEDDLQQSVETARVVVRNNVAFDIDRTMWGGNGRIFQITTPNRPVLGIKFDHNSTFVVQGNAALVMGDTVAVATNLFFSNNLVSRGDYGVFGSGQSEGTAALAFFAPGYVFKDNAIIGATAASYPPKNFFPATPAACGFVDYAGDDFHLKTSSSLHGAATDGSDVGADIDLVDSGTLGVAP